MQWRGSRDLPDYAGERTVVGCTPAHRLSVQLRDRPKTIPDGMLHDDAPDHPELVASRLDERATVQVVRPPERTAGRDPGQRSAGPVLAPDRRQEPAQLDRERGHRIMLLKRAFPDHPLERDGAVLEPRAIPPLTVSDVVHQLRLRNRLQAASEADVRDDRRCDEGGAPLASPEPGVPELDLDFATVRHDRIGGDERPVRECARGWSGGDDRDDEGKGTTSNERSHRARALPRGAERDTTGTAAPSPGARGGRRQGPTGHSVPASRLTSSACRERI